MRLDIKSKILFLSNPKTGSISVRDVLDNNYNYNCYQHNEYLDNLHREGLCPDYYNDSHTNAIHMKNVLSNIYNLDINDFFSFAFIRNPWDRIVSAYSYQKRDKNGIEWYDNNYDINTACTYPFSDFIKNITTEKLWNSCGVPSLENFCFDNNNCIVKKIYKIEDFKLCQLEKDISDFLNKPFKFTNINELPTLNTSDRKKYYNEYYTENWMIEKVREIYKSDIEFGNYDF